MNNMKHPAKYSDCLLPIFEEMLKDSKLVLDPFAGTGKLKLIRPDAILLEIEPEWAEMNGAIVGDVTDMPKDWTDKFDAICTSPCYGNRLADNFVDKSPNKIYERNTYRCCLGRPLHPNNSGRLQWGEKYREFHVKAYKECKRVLKHDGLFILNMSDHIRNGKIQYVTDWHIKCLTGLNFELIKHVKVQTPRYKKGSNNSLRVKYESIVLFKNIKNG